MERKRKNELTNAFHEGENHFNTDYTKAVKTEEELELEQLHKFKPVQHPVNLHGEDTGIISYKVPPKALTPYY